MFKSESLPNHPFSLIQAVARMEGWYNDGSVPNRPQRNNNPGNINYGLFAARFDGVLETGETHNRFARFPSAAKGWEALDALFRTPLYYRLTIRQAIMRYAPPVENNSDLYVLSVCHWMDRNPDELVCNVIGDEPQETTTTNV